MRGIVIGEQQGAGRSALDDNLARERLQRVLDDLNPMAGIRDHQNTPEHAERRAKKKPKKNK